MVTDLRSLMIFCFFGALGGFVTFLLAMKRGRIRNNHYARKVGIEVLGGMATAGITTPVLSLAFKPEFLNVAAFGIGMAWAAICENIRTVVTSRIEKALNDGSASSENPPREG
jgi:hypothetical protein